MKEFADLCDFGGNTLQTWCDEIFNYFDYTYTMSYLHLRALK